MAFHDTAAAMEALVSLSMLPTAAPTGAIGTHGAFSQKSPDTPLHVTGVAVLSVPTVPFPPPNPETMDFMSSGSGMKDLDIAPAPPALAPWTYGNHTLTVPQRNPPPRIMLHSDPPEAQYDRPDETSMMKARLVSAPAATTHSDLGVRRVSRRGRGARVDDEDHMNDKRKMSHNAVERRRRNIINDNISELHAAIPSLDWSSKPSKATILRAAIEHIHDLTDENIRLRDRAEAIDIENERQRQEIGRLREMLGLSPPSPGRVSSPLVKSPGQHPQAEEPAVGRRVSVGRESSGSPDEASMDTDDGAHLGERKRQMMNSV